MLQFSLFFLLAVGVAVLIAHLFTQNINAIFNQYRKVQRKQRRKLESINQILQKQATTDTLTGLYNRQYFNKELEREISRAGRYERPLSLILFDIDRFKKINDTFGHLRGDKVLIELSQLITTHVRQSDVLARWGGEEFVLLLPEITKDKACNTAEKIRGLLAAHDFSIPLPVTCSFGVTELTREDRPVSLLSRADKALYDAKNAGRDAICTR